MAGGTESEASTAELAREALAAAKRLFARLDSDEPRLRRFTDAVTLAGIGQELENVASAINVLSVAQAGSFVPNPDPVADTFASAGGESVDDEYVAVATGTNSDPFIAEEIAHRLGWPARYACSQVDEALGITTLLPNYLRRAGTVGDLSASTVGSAMRELDVATPAVRAAVDEWLAENPHAPRWGRRKMRTQVRQHLLKVAPTAVAEPPLKKLAHDFQVWSEPHEVVGLAVMHAVMTVDDSMHMMNVIGAAAKQIRGDQPELTMGQARVMGLVDAVTNNAEIRTELTLLVPVNRQHTAVSRQDVAGMAGRAAGASTAGAPIEKADVEIADLEIAEVGIANVIVPAVAARPLGTDGLTATGGHPPHHPPDDPPDDRLERFPDVVLDIGTLSGEIVDRMARAVGTTFRLALYDAADGTLISTTTSSYRPTAAIRRFVELRDGHCRFPGCDIRAAACDIDHVDAWKVDDPATWTSPANLQCLCRRHHRIKSRGRWRVTMTPDGTSTWTSPTGDISITIPASKELLVPA